VGQLRKVLAVAFEKNTSSSKSLRGKKQTDAMEIAHNVA